MTQISKLIVCYPSAITQDNFRHIPANLPFGGFPSFNCQIFVALFVTNLLRGSTSACALLIPSFFRCWKTRIFRGKGKGQILSVSLSFALQEIGDTESIKVRPFLSCCRTRLFCRAFALWSSQYSFDFLAECKHEISRDMAIWSRQQFLIIMRQQLTVAVWWS